VLLLSSLLLWWLLLLCGRPLNGSGGAGAGGGGGAGGRSRDRADVDPVELDKSVTWDSVGGLERHVQQLKEMVMLPLMCVALCCVPLVWVGGVGGEGLWSACQDNHKSQRLAPVEQS